MIVKDETVRVLRDFCGINDSIVIYPGDVIRSRNDDGDILAEYKPGVVFHEVISIYDLARFLNSMKILGPDPEMVVNGDMIMLSSNGQNIQYGMSPEDTMIKMDQSIEPFEPMVQFTIKNEDLRKIRQAAAALGVQHLSITQGEGDMIVRVHQLATESSNPTDDYYDFEIGPVLNGDGSKCEFVFDINSLPTFEGDYTVSLSNGVVSMFKNNFIDLTYWVAMREETKIGD